MSSRVLGVDACKAGWVGVVVHDGAVVVHVAKTIAELVAVAEIGGDLAVIGIDIPIGLPDTGRRQADLLAYNLLGVHDAGAGRVGGRQPCDGGASEPGASR